MDYDAKEEGVATTYELIFLLNNDFLSLLIGFRL